MFEPRSSMEMGITNDQRRLLALCAIRIDQESVDWSLLAREAQFVEGLDNLWSGTIQETSAVASRARPVLRFGINRADELFERVDAEVRAAAAVGAQLITVLDRDYPANLRLVPNLPPFLFVRGDLTDEDVRSAAVVGTRDASDAGLRRAQRMSQMLAQRGVTVISGMAKGIDTAAHRAALEAGGRTIAVFGTGITKCYPPENRGLAEEIIQRGALVSQFWPTRSPGRDTFPRRNVVTSGLSQGTVVIEASRTSGAKMQARLALEHGKKVFLVKSLVTDQQWAKDYVAKRGAIEVADVDEVIRHLAEPERVRQAGEQRQQLTFASL
jgi:DNA processing protein